MSLQRIYGKYSVEAALRSGRRKIYKLSVYHPNDVSRPTKEQLDVRNLINIARNHKVPVEFVSKDILNQWSDGRPHQNSVLSCEPLILPEINSEKAFSGLEGLCLILDGLKDGQNIGTLIRTSYFLGVSAVILNEM